MSKTPKGSVTRRQLVGIVVFIADTAAIIITMSLCRRSAVQVTVSAAPTETVHSDTMRQDTTSSKDRVRQRLRQKLIKKSGQGVKMVQRRPRPRNYELEPDKE